MKCLFLSAKRYSINDSVIRGFIASDWDIKVCDYEDFFHKSVNSFVSKYESIPNKIKRFWKDGYIQKINSGYIKVFDDYNPDLVFIYNNQNALPKTIEHFKKSSKVVFLLGDNPLYSPTNAYNLHILFYADYIISPDTFWMEQLEAMGIENTYFDCFSFNPDLFYPQKPKTDIFDMYQSDFVYVGNAHKNNWGYKRFLFLNQFSKFNLKAFLSGESKNSRWLSFFPELRKRVVLHNEYSPTFNNMVYNCSKIAPIEMVPALFNGIHVRVFDALGSGIFPLCEYSKDIEMIFDGIGVPLVKRYQEASKIAADLLDSNDHRIDLVNRMRSRVQEVYSPPKVINRMLARLGS